MNANKETKGKQDNFSVALGLFDYINPIFYSITMITLIRHLRGVMDRGTFILFVAGAVVSLVFGLTIPTVKLIVGLGYMQFKMPVNLVFYVNSGILLTGIALLSEVMELKPLALAVILLIVLAFLAAVILKTGKFNTVAVLTGAAGYLMIYACLIALSRRMGAAAPVYLYAAAICLFVFLCGLGIKGNLKDARVHWVIESCNVLCQGCVALATVLLFR